MKELIAFPHLGTYYRPIKKMVKALTNMDVLDTPPITKKTIALGSKHSPDSVCVPFKYNLGNFIEALDMGATIILQAGGGCRYRYYAEVQETILKDLGYDFRFIQIIGKDHLRLRELYSLLKGLNNGLKKRKFIHELLMALFYVKYLDEAEDMIRQRVGFEVKKNSFKKLKDEFLDDLDKCNSLFKLRKTWRKYRRKIKKVPVKKPKDCIKVGIIGELYTAMEPFSTYELERMLAKYHIEIKRFTNLSYLLWKKPLLAPYVRWKSKRYCKYTLGADGLDNVYRTLWLKKHNYDGIIHTKPVGCTPEIGAMPIIMKAAKENEMPIIFLSFDEQTSSEGLKTRIEAFYDLLYVRKETKK